MHSSSDLIRGCAVAVIIAAAFALGFVTRRYALGCASGSSVPAFATPLYIPAITARFLTGDPEPTSVR